MRIIGGELKGKVLSYPKEIRPAESKVRSAIFEILKERIKNSLVLDLFCGAGSLGIEALSRGAKSVTFVDNSPIVLRYLKKNLVGLENKVAVFKADVPKIIRRLKQSYTLIFIDPPYFSKLSEKVLKNIVDCGILASSGLIFLKTHKKELPSPLIKGNTGRFLKVLERRNYGETCITIISQKDENRSLSGKF